MDKQIKYLLGLLILLLITAYFLSLFSGLPQYFKNDIIAFLEEKSAGEISFNSVSLWPLNRLRLNSFTFKDEYGTKLKVEQLNLNYNFNFSDLDSLIEINLIEALNAEIIISEETFSDISAKADLDLAAAEKESDKASFKLSALNLPGYLKNININILNSKLELQTKELSFQLRELNLGLKAKNLKKYDLNLSTAAKINNLRYKDYLFQDIDLDNFKLSFARDKSEANLYFESSYLNLKPLLTLLAKDSYSYQNFKLNLNSVKGDFKTKGQLNFKEDSILDYKSEINFSNLNFNTLYQDQKTAENLKVEFNDLELILSGPGFNLAAVDNQLLVDKQRLDFSLKVKQNFDYQLKLAAENFNYNYDFFEKYLDKANLSFNLSLEGREKNLKRAYADVQLQNIKNKFIDINSSNFILRLADQEIFMEKAEVKLENNSKLEATASYNLKDSSYLLRSKAAEVKITAEIISLLKEYKTADNYLNQLRKIENDKLDFIVDAAGDYSQENGISAAGDLNFNFSFNSDTEKEKKIKLASSFWYTEDKLFLDSAKVNSNFAYLDLIGEVDFSNKKFDLRYAAKNFELAPVLEIAEFNSELLAEINPNISYLEGQITNNFKNPEITMDLNLEQLQYKNYSLGNIEARLNYENKNLNLINLKAAINQSQIRADGEIKNLLTKPEIDLELESENLYFEDLNYLVNQELPLTGQLSLKASIAGLLDDYKLNFKLDTSNTVFNYQDKEYEILNLSSLITKKNNNFQIENFSFEHQNLNFKAAGIYNLKSGFDLNYQLSGFEFKNYINKYPKIANKLTGSLSLKGQLKGMLEQAVLSFKVNDENFFYNGFNINIKENNFKADLEKNKIELEKFNFSIASGNYQLRGDIFNFDTEVESELKLKIIEMPLKEYFEEYLKLYPFAKNIIVKGESEIKTQGSSYNAVLDIAAYLAGEKEKSFSLEGNINRDLDLKFRADSLPIDYVNTDYDFNLDLKSTLNFAGNISGNIETPILNLNHSFISPKINDTSLESIKGNILVENDRRFSASEKIDFIEGGNLELDFSYSMAEEEINLSSSLEELPLSFILSFVGDSVTSDGQINGNIRAEGTLEEPKLTGELVSRGRTLEVGIWAPIKNFSGQINLRNQKAQLKNFKGQFVDGDFSLGGEINLFNLDNFWNLSLNAKELYFDYGSLEGDFDSQLTFSGAAADPLLKGEIQAYDFNIGIPFKWSADNDDDQSEKKKDSSSFVPRIDLKIIPESNLRVKNQNMNVLVQSGDLKLNYNQKRDNKLMMEGRLKSNQGRFNYYNSRFTLNSAEAVFSPVDEDDIPNLQANATTYAGGREININVNGPANSMNISLISNPEMTEEEILNLLSTRGALGSAVIGGEDIGVQDIIFQELMRIVNGVLQEDIISDIESDFRTILSLDRIEIDAYQFGLEREFAIYLGKNISKRFYMEYAGFFGEEERENEISFQYKLTEKTNLKGTYFGDDEYQITLENEIEF